MAIPGTGKVLTVFIALVWAVNGLGCKVLNMVPRHTEIVGIILGLPDPRPVTIAIGFAETILAIWIVTGKYRKLTATLQITLVLTMNIIEFLLVPEMLLWGKMNLIFAILFSVIIYVHGFIMKPQAIT
jgi:DoxX-like family